MFLEGEGLGLGLGWLLLGFCCELLAELFELVEGLGVLAFELAVVGGELVDFVVLGLGGGSAILDIHQLLLHSLIPKITHKKYP